MNGDGTNSDWNTFPSSRTAVRTRSRRRSAEIAAYRTSNAQPPSQTHAASSVRICSGFALCAGSGVNAACKGGFTMASTAGMPLVMAGAAEYTISGCTGSALGMRLSTLSIENGHKSRTAASAHRAHSSHFGAFLNTSRTSTTAKIRTAADRLRLRKPRKRFVMAASPHSRRSWRAAGRPRPAKASSCARTPR